MADQEQSATDDRLDVVQARESKRRHQVLRHPGGGRTPVAVPDGGHRGGRTSLKAALRPWQFVRRDDEDDDNAA